MSSDRGNIMRPTSISPPPKRRRMLVISPESRDEEHKRSQNELHHGNDKSTNGISTHLAQANKKSYKRAPRMISSPVQLNFVDELPAPSNVDTVSLGSILGNVLIRECWLFNYLFDLDFIMSQFDPDIRNIVNVHIVHGSWRREDPNKKTIDDTARRYQNVDVTTAYMPEPFGTHHSKMIILFRHDDLAQIIILTGNFIERDWCMSQAVWQSPLLPLLNRIQAIENVATHPPGSGLRFKYDLMAYIKSYGVKLKHLLTILNTFDFTEIRAALIASTPGKQNLQSTDPETETLWGWPSLKYILSHVSRETRPTDSGKARSQDESKELIPHVVIQVSSIASIGAKWLTTALFPALSVLKKSSSENSGNAIEVTENPRFSIVFPSAETIRKSVNGYGSGASIHMKTQTPAQAKQLSDIRPMLCHWAGNAHDVETVQAAGRKCAAPHIKSYVRFSDSLMQQIDWAMVTSANLSTQAWGAVTSASGEVRICSYEIGVIVWPALWNDLGKDEEDVRMIPVFGRDTPEDNDQKVTNEVSLSIPQMRLDLEQQPSGARENDGSKETKRQIRETMVGWRMPYDLPLVPYEKDEVPWCASEPCDERDWLGRSWPGYKK